jgi:intein/homing endonuclease
MSDFSPLAAYESGLVGCSANPRADEELVDSIIRHGGDPDGASVAHHWEFADAGKGKLSLIYPAIETVFPGALPGPPQLWGDCFPPGTLVRMADGSEKPIESIKAGEAVVSHRGIPRRVEASFKKPYTGDLTTISVSGGPRSVTCTPDHRIVAGGEGSDFWCPAELLTEGTEVLLPRYSPENDPITFDLQDNDRVVVGDRHPRCIRTAPAGKIRYKSSQHSTNRFVTLDSRLGWLIGLYLAEGSCDRGKYGPRRITFNLSSRERSMGEYAASLINEIFGVEATARVRKSKESVLLVRVCSAPVASLFARLAPGNTYTKRVSKEILSSPRAVRLAALRGWFAGDGHVKSGKKQKHHLHDSVSATAVSVSHGLVSDMFDLANSCGISSSVTYRKARGRSRVATNLSMYGNNAVQVFPGTWGLWKIKESASKVDGELGAWKKVSAVERAPFSGEVYCLEVAEDHSFVAEGFAVHNCVGAAAANAYLGSLAQEIVDARPDEVTGKVEGPPDIPSEGVKQGVVARESIFAWRGWTEPNGRGKSSDGWFCSAAAKALTEKGVLVRKPYPELGFDLTKYTKQTIRLGGSTKPSDEWFAESSQYIARTATVLKGREQVRDFLAAGYAIFNCSALAFERTRDGNGVSRQRGVWHHAQAFTGYDDREITIKIYGQPLVLWTNSWGGSWNSGPRSILGTNMTIPPGSYWAMASTIDRCQCIAVSSVAGWPRRRHTTFGATGNV